MRTCESTDCDESLEGEHPLKRYCNKNCYMRQYRRDNRDRTRELSRQANRRYRDKNPDYHLRERYGLSGSEFEEMLEDQDGCCAICGTQEDPLHVDHCHSTGEVRALLCGNCNRGIGVFQESPEVLRKAAAYVEAA